MWGQTSHILEDIEVESESLTKFRRRLQHAREQACRRWSREYVRSLMEQHRMKGSDAVIPGVGEIVLVVGEQKNRGIWMKGKVYVTLKEEMVLFGEQSCYTRDVKLRDHWSYSVHWRSELTNKLSEVRNEIPSIMNSNNTTIPLFHDTAPSFDCSSSVPDVSL